MKTKFTFCLMSILLISCSISYAETIWENLNFPTIKTTVTSVTARGEDIYAGTTNMGLFVTTDNGKRWDNTEVNLSGVLIKFLFHKDKGLIIAMSEDEIYTTENGGEKWNKFSHFREREEIINCYAVGPTGILYIGTNKALWYSSNNAENWERMTTSMGEAYILSVAVNRQSEIFFSTSSGDRGEIYRSVTNGEKWEAKHEGISGDYKAKKIVVKDNLLYAWLRNDIYISEDRADNWTLLEKAVEDKAINKIEITADGDLFVVQDEIVSIWDNAYKEWVLEKDRTNLPDVVSDAELDDEGYAFAFVGNKIYKSIIKIGDLIREFHPIYTVRVVDDKNNIFKNTSFNIIKNGLGAGIVKTDDNGYFKTTEQKFSIGDKLKISKFVHSVPAVKPGHSGMGNIMHSVFLDNVQFDENGISSDFTLTNDFNPTIKANHTDMLYNLLVSIQWDATQEYMDSLESYLRTMSNYLYDVTDGQLRLHQVDIYDNRVKWDESDIKMFASNQVWPNANVGSINTTGGHAHIPRKWYGNSKDTRNFTARTDWLSTFNGYHYTTIAHELGHYMFGFWDEYVYMDGTDPTLLPFEYNYGFMDYQYPNGNNWSSEMSSIERYPYSSYKITAQWGLNGSDCWDMFEKDHEGKFNDVWVPVIRPQERALGGRDFLIGPNNDLNNPDFNVGKFMVVNKYNHQNNAGSATITAIIDGVKYGEVPMMLMKPKNNSFIKVDQGKTADNGKIIILGANVGDQVRVNYYEVQYGAVWSDTQIITSVVPVTGGTILQDIEMNLKKMDGSFILDNELQYNQKGNLELIARPVIPFKNQPKMEVEDTQGLIKEMNFPFDDNSKGYKYEFEQSISSGQLDIVANDNSGALFYIPYNYVISPMAQSIISGNGEFLLSPDMNLNSGIEEFAIVSTPFFTSRTGLDKDAERGSDIFLLASYPVELAKDSRNVVSIRYEESYLVNKDQTKLKIFRWDYLKNEWAMAGSTVDTLQKVVYGAINQVGCYALFTKDDGTGIDDNMGMGILNLFINPNPVSAEASLSFELGKAGNVSISIFNYTGMELIKVIDSEYMDEGWHEIKLPSESLTQGNYFCKVSSGSYSEAVSLIIVR